MWLLLALAVLVLLAVPIAFAIQRSTELFVIDVAGGRVRLVRGRLPSRLFGDIEDVVRRAGLSAAWVRVVIDGTRPRVHASPEVPSGVEQQLRNIVGTYQVAQLRNGNMRP
jgi:hypothetical protein